MGLFRIFFYIPCLPAKKMMCPSGFFQSKVVSWKFLMGQLKSTVWPLIAVTRCHTARETASQWKWLLWEVVRTLFCVWERCHGGRQKEIFGETTPKDVAAPPRFTQFWCDRKCVVCPYMVKEKVSRRVKLTFGFLWGGVRKHSCGGHDTSGPEQLKVIGPFFPRVGCREDVT